MSLSTKKTIAKRNWQVIDARSKTLGRLATEIAKYLMGKHQVEYTPNIDSGDYVVVLYAKDLVVTGNKLSDKKYYSHSGQPGGFKEKPLGSVLATSPRKVIEHAVKGMLPKNKLQQPRLRRLKVYDEGDHPHTSQITN